MTPQLVHRYSWPVREAIEHLLDQVVGDCTAWQVRIEGEELVIDVVGPAEVTFRVGDYEYTVDGRGQQPSNDAAKSDIAAPEADAAPLNKSPEHDAAPAEPQRKGGALARQAGIICGEKGFWTFVAKKFGVTVGSADEAADWLRMHCGVASRAILDHDEANASVFREIDRSYRLWLEGYD